MSKFTDMINGETPVLVDFTAEWCGPCKMMAPILQQTAEKLGNKLKIVKVDIDRNPEATSFYQVQGVPTLILFKEGKTLWRQSGLLQAGQLMDTINRFISK